MTDIYDRATELEEQFRDIALEEQQRRAKLGQGDNWQQISAEFCEDDNCGVSIPEARRRAIPGVRFCVDCQELRERRNRT